MFSNPSSPGFLFSFPINLFLICSCSALGATNCFLLFSILGRKIIVRYFPDRVVTWNGQVRQNNTRCLTRRDRFFFSNLWFRNSNESGFLNGVICTCCGTVLRLKWYFDATRMVSQPNKPKIVFVH